MTTLAGYQETLDLIAAVKACDGSGAIEDAAKRADDAIKHDGVRRRVKNIVSRLPYTSPELRTDRVSQLESALKMLEAPDVASS